MPKKPNPIEELAAQAGKKGVHPGGRPSKYTKELGARICAQLAQGISLRKVCLDEDLPALSTVFLWMMNHKEFSEQYDNAKSQSSEAQHEYLSDMGDEIMQITMNPPKGANVSAAVQAYKLHADNLKWSMARMKPKKYGDKIDHTTNGKDLPTPLLNVLRNNNSNKTSSEPEEEN